jgi:hypothetical protein
MYQGNIVVPDLNSRTKHSYPFDLDKNSVESPSKTGYLAPLLALNSCMLQGYPDTGL